MGKLMYGMSVLGLIVLFGIFGTTLYFSTQIANISMKFYQLEMRNKRVINELETYVNKTENLKEVLLNLKEKDQEIRRLLGLKPNNKYFSISLKKK